MFEELVGQRVQSITFSDDGTEMTIKTEGWKYSYLAEGDCCAVAYVLKPDAEDIKAFLGNEIIQTKTREHSTSDGDFYQIDTEFYDLRTHGGDLTLELRTEHNGYYCGWLKKVGQEEIWPVFDDIREEAQKVM